MRAVNAVNELIAPALIGMDAAGQQAVDQAMLDIGKLKVGGNATAAVSAAALKAGAAALDIPLYQHIGGVNACTLPVPGVISLVGSDRYGSGARSGGKPSYAFMCYGFETFSEASYAGWDISVEWSDVLNKKLGDSQTLRSPCAGGVARHRERRPGNLGSDGCHDQQARL